MEISFNYPLWYILLCGALGLIYAFFFYRKDSLLEELSKTWKYFLTTLRFLSVTILAILLLEPLLQTVDTTVEKPVIILAQDNSESIVAGADSTSIKSEYKQDLKKTIDKLSEKFNVVNYQFGDEVKERLSLDYKEKTTDISTVFDEIFTRYYNRNIGAIILGSDGIYNRGTDPKYAASKIKNVPIYTIALGDTNTKKDLLIKEVAHNRLAYLGNDFPLEIGVEANILRGKSYTVSILQGAKIIKSKQIAISEDAYFEVIPFTLSASTKGLQKYSIQLTEMDGESILENNTKDIFIDILDSKQKVLMLCGTLSPDITAIKQAITSNKNYQIDVEIAKKYKADNLKDYSLIIAHQVPFTGENSGLEKKLESSGLPVFYVVGGKTNFGKFNQLKKGLQVIAPRGLTEAQAIANNQFSLFKLDEKLKKEIEKFPPLTIPFAGEYRTSNNSEVLFHQKVGTVRSNYPLLFFSKNENRKYAYLLGEGIWRWKITDFKNNQSNELFNNFINKIIQYMSSKDDKSFFRVFAETNYLENQNVIIDAEVYNESYELDNSLEVQLTLTNDQNEVFEYQFSKTSNAYKANLGQLSSGEYTFVAKTKRGQDLFETSGQFSVSELKIELTNQKANHQLLYSISQESGGELLYPNQLSNLSDILLNKKEIVDISYAQKKVTDLIHWKWVFFLILVLLTIEWFLRKRHGAY